LISFANRSSLADKQPATITRDSNSGGGAASRGSRALGAKSIQKMLILWPRDKRKDTSPRTIRRPHRRRSVLSLSRDRASCP